MSDFWSIQRANGSVKSFGEAGVVNAIRTLYNQDVDTVKVSFGFGDMLGDSYWPYKEWITILRDGAPWFQGYVSKDNPSAEGSKESHSITLAGPWKQLVRQTYMQLSAWVSSDVNEILQTLPFPYVNPDGSVNSLTAAQQAANDNATADPDNYPHREVMTSVILLYSTLSGDTWDTNQMITDVLNFAISKGVNLAIGTLAAGITVPQEEVKDKSCADVIKRILSWQADISVWFDYTVTPPTFNTIKRADRAALTLTQGTDLFTVTTLEPLYDLLISGVTLNYIEPQTNTGFTFYTLAQDQAGPDPTGIGSLQATLQLLGGTVYDQNQTVYQNGQPIPVGLAAYLYSVYGVLQYQGKVGVSRDECPAGNPLTQSLNVVGLRGEWASMGATIQSVADEVFRGVTTYNVGAPLQLTASSLAALVQARGNFQTVSTLGQSRFDGGVPSPNLQQLAQAPPGAYSGPVGTVDPDSPGLPTGPYSSYVPTAHISDLQAFGGSVVVGPFLSGIPVPVTNSALPALPTEPKTPQGAGGLSASDAYALETESTGGGNFGTEASRTSSYSTGTVDLTGLSINARARIYLVGTQVVSDGTGTGNVGNTTTKIAHMQLSFGTGVFPITISAKLGAPYNRSGSPTVGSFQSASGSVSYTEIRVYAAKSL